MKNRKPLLAFLLALGGVSLIYALDRPEIKQDPDALYITTAAAQKVAFHGATPVIQRSGSAQTALTNSTTGTSTTTLAAGVGVTTIIVPLNLASIADGDVLTNYTPGYKFKILSVSFAVNTPVTTGSKATTLNLEIGSTNTTGGAVALTSANCTPIGALVAGTAITAANTGSSSDTISVEAASTTAFAEGSGYLLIKLQNMDVADAAAGIVTLVNELRAALVEKGLIAGS